MCNPALRMVEPALQYFFGENDNGVQVLAVTEGREGVLPATLDTPQSLIKYGVYRYEPDPVGGGSIAVFDNEYATLALALKAGAELYAQPAADENQAGWDKLMVRTAELSTEHISPEDNAILAASKLGDDKLLATPHAFGFFVSVPPAEDPDALEAQLKAGGYSRGFQAVLRDAQQRGISSLLFDRDAPVHPKHIVNLW